MTTAVNIAVDGVINPLDRNTDTLEKVYQSVNKRFFKNAIDATIHWDVPKGTVSVFTGTPGNQLTADSEEHALFEAAKGYIESNQLEKSIPPLMACAEANHPESKLLLSHILKRKNDNRWQEYAAAYNQHFTSVRVVPAACYYPETQSIAIHPHLQESNAPQFVLKYLIYHECCHQLVECSDDAPHPEEFMVWENKAPNRERALSWLEQKGFPTLRTADDC